jgi:GMP synthase PP-ATPase subunit
LYDKVWQAGATCFPQNSVGVGDDERTYEKVALRAVDQLTEHCGLGTFTYDFLMKVFNIINKVKG